MNSRPLSTRRGAPRKMFTLDNTDDSQQKSYWDQAPTKSSSIKPFKAIKGNIGQAVNVYQGEKSSRNEPRQEYNMYITDSDDDLSMYRPPGVKPKILSESDDLCQRISNLMKKTRMNSLQRKTLTTGVVDKENIGMWDNMPLTPREGHSGAFKTAEFNKDSTSKHLSFRSSTHNLPMPTSEPTHAEVPYPLTHHLIPPSSKTFGKKSMSTQEYVPIQTSSELSKAIKGMSKQNLETK